MGNERYCLQCEGRGAGPRTRRPLRLQDATQNCFTSFSLGLLQHDFYRGLIHDVGSVQRLHNLASDFSFSYGSDPAAPLLDQLDLVISESVAVALLCAVRQICEYYCSQRDFSTIKVQLESRCRGMHQFGIFSCQSVLKHVAEFVSSVSEPGFSFRLGWRLA